VPDFASQLAKISSGELEPVVKVGNLEAERDFTDVRDIVRAYRMLADSGSLGQSYLVCSGTSVSIQHILNTLIKISGIDVEVIKDPDRYRPLETPVIYGNNTKIKRETGWQPSISLEKSLSDAYNEWRARYK
jgi:GDP-4-dehydro-6-deoxy-D-mannose reductase